MPAKRVREALQKYLKSTLNNRLHRNLACVIDKSSRGAKLERAFEELPKLIRRHASNPERLDEEKSASRQGVRGFRHFISNPLQPGLRLIPTADDVAQISHPDLWREGCVCGGGPSHRAGFRVPD